MEGTGGILESDNSLCGSPSVVQIIQKVHIWMSLSA